MTHQPGLGHAAASGSSQICKGTQAPSTQHPSRPPPSSQANCPERAACNADLGQVCRGHGGGEGGRPGWLLVLGLWGGFHPSQRSSPLGASSSLCASSGSSWRALLLHVSLGCGDSEGRGRMGPETWDHPGLSCKWGLHGGTAGEAATCRASISHGCCVPASSRGAGFSLAASLLLWPSEE